ncbi:MAG: hypothetical protein ACLGHN_10285 [Bacteriovoracia bacterium]
MKHLLICFLVSTFMASWAFAGETTTECIMMKEENSRNNPKANLSSTKPKPKKDSSASAQ